MVPSVMWRVSCACNSVLMSPGFELPCRGHMCCSIVIRSLCAQQFLDITHCMCQVGELLGLDQKVVAAIELHVMQALDWAPTAGWQSRRRDFFA